MYPLREWVMCPTFGILTSVLEKKGGYRPGQPWPWPGSYPHRACPGSALALLRLGQAKLAPALAHTSGHSSWLKPHFFKAGATGLGDRAGQPGQAAIASSRAM
ncbi:hypothetical protein AMTR_s00029p00214820 [Amborella trichopoda]|uniref:Uncharacterized protein n=1 Tax=Amborella trichopoda TaxID=13333 RepID=W1PPI7_AMBTC|nr:hypothetical protein AMTR_s00029p00214820 [Amborella trichopoda]